MSNGHSRGKWNYRRHSATSCPGHWQRQKRTSVAIASPPRRCGGNVASARGNAVYVDEKSNVDGILRFINPVQGHNRRIRATGGGSPRRLVMVEQNPQRGFREILLVELGRIGLEFVGRGSQNQGDRLRNPTERRRRQARRRHAILTARCKRRARPLHVGLFRLVLRAP